MAPLPQPKNHTVDAIYAAYEASRRQEWEGLGISISNLGEECERSLWYGFRWASAPEKITGLKAITFETGEIEEGRLLNSLRMIGCEVIDLDPATGKQFRYSAAHGHIRGKADAKAIGIPEAPRTMHMVECKSAKAEYFRKIVKSGVKDGYYAHYVQNITYTYLDGLDRALYMCRNKDTGEIYTERLELDREEAIRLIARGERVVFSAEPPAKLHEDPTKKVAFKCGFCRHKAVCHERAFPRVHCRTCIHASPISDGDAEWSCARWSKPLSTSEQRAGCPAHLFIPALINGEVLDANEEAETITYRLPDGSTWVDGGGKPAEVDEAEGT